MARDNDTDPLAGRFGRWHQLALALGGVFGSGWLMAIPRTTEAGWWAVLSWCLAAAMIGLITLLVVQLAKAKPSRAGLASWPTNSSGRVIGTVMSAGVFVVYAGNPPAGTLAAIIALEKTGLVSGLTTCESGQAGLPSLTGSGLPIAILLMTALFLVNLIGFAMVLRLNTVLTAVKLALPVLFIVLVMALGPDSPQSGEVAFGCEDVGSPGLWSDQVAFAFQSLITSGLIFSLTGFQGPVDHGNKGKRRHVGFAMFGALLITTVLYLALQALFITNHWSGWPLALASQAKTVLMVTMVLAPITNALLFMSLAGKVLRTSATQNNVSLPWANLGDKRRELPINALIATWMFGLLLLLLSEWSQITSAKSVIFLFVYSFAAISYAAYRKTAAPDEKRLFVRSFRVLGPVSFALATTLAFYAGLSSLLQTYLLITGVAGLMFWSKRKSLSAEWRKDLKNARWILGYFIVLATLAATRFITQWVTVAGGDSDMPPLVDLLLGTANFPPVRADMNDQLLMHINQISVHVLAGLAFALGLWGYRAGVRRSVAFLGEKPQDERPDPVTAPPAG